MSRAEKVSLDEGKVRLFATGRIDRRDGSIRIAPVADERPPHRAFLPLDEALVKMGFDPERVRHWR